MARNAVSSRLRVAFFVLAATFAAAILSLAYALSPVTIPAHAQSLCVPAERFAQRLSEQETVTDVFILGHEGTGLYLEAVTGMEAPPEANAIIFIAQGEAALVPVVNGMACAEYGVIQINPLDHQRGMRAVYGQAI